MYIFGGWKEQERGDGYPLHSHIVFTMLIQIWRHRKRPVLRRQKQCRTFLDQQVHAHRPSTTVTTTQDTHTQISQSSDEREEKNKGGREKEDGLLPHMNVTFTVFRFFVQVTISTAESLDTDSGTAEETDARVVGYGATVGAFFGRRATQELVELER